MLRGSSGVSRVTIALILAAIIVVAVVALFLFMPRGPQFPDTIVIGTTDRISDLDPANAYDFFTWEVLINVGEGPFVYEPGTLKLVEGIISSYEVQENGKVYILNLKRGVKFPNGKEVTAEIMKYSIDRVATIQGDPSWFVLDFIDSVEVVDEYTLKITLKAPVSFYQSVLAVPTYFPVDPDAYPMDEITPDNTAGSVGRYMITQWVRDQSLVLEANPNYYGEPPKTKRIIIKFYKDSSSLRLALEGGEIDIAWRTLDPADINSLKENPNFQVIEGAGSFIRYIVFNTNIEPFDDVRVRKALAAALDRSELADTVFLGMMDPLYSLVPNGMWSHEDIFKDKYGDGNLDLAKQLLREAGYSEENKLRITLWYTTSHYGTTEADLAALIKDQWERTGLVEVSVQGLEWSTYLERTRNEELAVTLYGWYPDYLDPDNFLYPFLHTGSNRWLGNPYSDPQMDKWLDDAQKSTDRNERSRLYQLVQDKLAEDAPIVPILQGKLFLVAKKSVKGIVVDQLMLLRYWVIYKEEEGSMQQSILMVLMAIPVISPRLLRRIKE